MLLRLAWDNGLTHPRWLFGTALRTVLRHGLPHFENSYRERGVPILSNNVTRDFAKRDHIGWDQLRAVRRQWHGSFIIKGVMNANDALQARDIGAECAIVSNHGGRQLDGTVSPLRVLPAVVAAVGDLPVMIDSGFRRDMC